MLFCQITFYTVKIMLSFKLMRFLDKDFVVCKKNVGDFLEIFL